MQLHSKRLKKKSHQHIKDLEFEKAHNVHRYLQNLEIIFDDTQNTIFSHQI